MLLRILLDIIEDSQFLVEPDEEILMVVELCLHYLVIMFCGSVIVDRCLCTFWR
jgi:hypothetical protein